MGILNLRERDPSWSSCLRRWTLQRERPGWFPLALVVACGLLFIGLGIMVEAKE